VDVVQGNKAVVELFSLYEACQLGIQAFLAVFVVWAGILLYKKICKIEENTRHG